MILRATILVGFFFLFFILIYIVYLLLLLCLPFRCLESLKYFLVSPYYYSYFCYIISLFTKCCFYILLFHVLAVCDFHVLLLGYCKFSVDDAMKIFKCRHEVGCGACYSGLFQISYSLLDMAVTNETE